MTARADRWFCFGQGCGLEPKQPQHQVTSGPVGPGCDDGARPTPVAPMPYRESAC